MTPEERDLLTDLLDRLKQADAGGRDPDAERAIAAAMAAQPSAPYYMAQLLLVQDQALSATQARIRELEERLRAAPPASPAASFLGAARASALGPWGRSADRGPAQVPSAVSAGPGSGPGWGPDRAVGDPSRSSGTASFLRGAMQTAAGVAGGALLFEGISSLFSHAGGAWGSGMFSSGAGVPVVQETIIEDFGGQGPAARDAALDPSSDAADPALLPADSPDVSYDPSDAAPEMDGTGALADDPGDLI